MTNIRTILYATDFSESSGPAADYALTLAKLSGATLHVLHVLGELADARRGRIPSSAFDLFAQEVEKQAVADMKQFCQVRFGDQVPFQTHLVHGLPFQQIIALANDLKADLIVAGTHGRTGIEHVLVGSTAERLVRRSLVPVLTVRG